MNSDKIKRMLDACYLAKRIRELLPELPEGVTPAYIQYMDVIHRISGRYFRGRSRLYDSDDSEILCGHE